MSEAITTGSEDRTYKMCKCAECGVKSVCTPSNDFYTIPKRDDDLLYCEPCMFSINKNTKGDSTNNAS